MNNIFIEGSIACCPHLVKFLQGKVLCIGTYSKGGLKVPLSVVDLGEGSQGTRVPPLFWVKKEEMTVYLNWWSKIQTQVFCETKIPTKATTWYIVSTICVSLSLMYLNVLFKPVTVVYKPWWLWKQSDILVHPEVEVSWISHQHGGKDKLLIEGKGCHLNLPKTKNIPQINSKVRVFFRWATKDSQKLGHKTWFKLLYITMPQTATFRISFIDWECAKGNCRIHVRTQN